MIGGRQAEGFSSQVGEATDDPNQQPTVEVLSHSRVMAQLLKKVEKIATTNASVFVLGETGVGKGLLAQTIHTMSARREQAFLAVNCAALPPGLIESALFGHEKGAFTSAAVRHAGYFERAHGGTLFLDEIGDVPLEMQGVLLHVLEEHHLTRVGGTASIPMDVRIIAATNRDLHQTMQEGMFREDLFQRLSVFPLVVPPLRQRREDIPRLARHFVRQYAHKCQRSLPSVSDEALAYLQAHRWPGNVRQLAHWVERMVILGEGARLELADVLEAEAMEQALASWASVPPLAAEGEAQEEPPLAEGADEKQHIIEALRKTNWIVSGQRGAAHVLGMSHKTLQYRMSKYGIQRPPSR